VVYIADDGERLRSYADVDKYLKKAGLAASPECLDLFNFDLCVPTAGEPSEGRGKREALSASETPIKDEGLQKGSTSHKAPAAPPEAEASAKGVGGKGRVSGGGSRGKRPVAATADAASDEPAFKKRNRELAQSRAAAFAMGRGFVDDAGRVPPPAQRAGGSAAGSTGGSASKKSRKGKEQADVAAADSEPAADGGEARESWPGPWSTANALYQQRDAAVEARQHASGGADKKIVEWQPSGRARRQKTAGARAIPTLQNMCIDIVATHIEACLEHGLGAILPEMKAKICENLCKKRRLLPDVLPIFTDRETAVLSLPDCSYIGEAEMAAAFERCQGPALEVLNLKYCGRSISDKLLENLFTHAANLHTLQIGGCYRVSDKGIACAVKALPHLRVLELSDCRNISKEALRSVAEVGGTLESLSLKNSTQLDSEALLHLAQLRKLKRLSLAGCRGASDVIVDMLADSCGATLEELDLSHLPDSGFTAEPHHCRISDASLEAIACKCAKLQTLTLRNCDSISDRGLLVLSEGACANLARLDLSRCKKVPACMLARCRRTAAWQPWKRYSFYIAYHLLLRIRLSPTYRYSLYSAYHLLLPIRLSPT